jgi:hypothetical protein
MDELRKICPWCSREFPAWHSLKIHVKNCPRSPRPRWLERKKRESPKTLPLACLECLVKPRRIHAPFTPREVRLVALEASEQIIGPIAVFAINLTM